MNQQLYLSLLKDHHQLPYTAYCFDRDKPTSKSIKDLVNEFILILGERSDAFTTGYNVVYVEYDQTNEKCVAVSFVSKEDQLLFVKLLKRALLLT